MVCAAALVAAPAAPAAPGLFSTAGLEGWAEKRFSERAPVRYRLAPDDGVPVLEADCTNGASGWYWEGPLDLERTPVLQWRWRVAQLPQGPSERTRAGDDFATRVYAVARTGFMPWQVRSLVYVWARAEPAGADWPSGYTARAHIVALRAGTTEAGVWREEARDLRADFRRYFGIEVSSVESIALMTDCDDGGGTAKAAYGDIRLAAGARQ